MGQLKGHCLERGEYFQKITSIVETGILPVKLFVKNSTVR